MLLLQVEIRSGCANSLKQRCCVEGSEKISVAWGRGCLTSAGADRAIARGKQRRIAFVGCRVLRLTLQDPRGGSAWSLGGAPEYGCQFSEQK